MTRRDRRGWPKRPQGYRPLLDYRTLNAATTTREDTMGRYLCCTCGEPFRDPRPPNPQRDHGFGTCEPCRVYLRSRHAQRPEDDHEAEVRSNLDERFA